MFKYKIRLFMYLNFDYVDILEFWGGLLSMFFSFMDENEPSVLCILILWSLSKIRNNNFKKILRVCN